MCVAGVVDISAQYDLRAAERARERLQGSEISGRPVSRRSLLYGKAHVASTIVSLFRQIDVHYSLPRDDHTKGIDREKNQVCSCLVAILAFIEIAVQQLQGTLQVTLRNSPSGQPIDDNEVRRKFQQFGDVKSVQPVGDRTELSVS